MNRLRQLRKEHHLTLIELAEIVHINKTSISRYELGEVEMKADVLKTFANYFNVTTDYLLGNTDNKNETLDTPTDEITLAFYNQHGIVTDEQKKEVESFIEFIKNKK